MSDLIVETRDGIARLELARPEKKNALTAAMYQGMRAALDAAEADPGVRAILVHGARDCFTAGNDLADFLERSRSGGPSAAFSLISRLPTLAKPLIAAVGGNAIGIGTTLLLHCDFVYAAPNARFQMPFVPLGLVPEAGSSLLLPMTAGYQRAAELLLLGRAFDVARAQAAGIITDVVPEDALFERARDTALALAALPAASVRESKRLMKRAHAALLAAQIEEERQVFAARLQSPEAREAMTAFFEKRKPDFSRFA